MPLGTVNHCSNGYTPWGSHLTCEENFHGYFGTEGTSWVRTDAQDRYGFSTVGFGYGWHRFAWVVVYTGDLGELLVNTRLAADLVGATKMDRPEWISVGADNKVYCTLTNNSERTVADTANPLAPNPDGHIIRWSETAGFPGTTFAWDIFLIAADREDTFSDPDGIWADPDGRLFIETDGGQKKGLNNQLLVANIYTGELRRLFTGITDYEVTGLTVIPDRRTLFVNIQPYLVLTPRLRVQGCQGRTPCPTPYSSRRRRPRQRPPPCRHPIA